MVQRRYLAARDISTNVLRTDAFNSAFAKALSPLEALYTGDDWRSSDTVASVQADRPLLPIPNGPAPSVAYFEVTVVDKGEHGYIGIGVGLDDFGAANKQPGWKVGSFGYHGDDGRSVPF